MLLPLLLLERISVHLVEVVVACCILERNPASLLLNGLSRHSPVDVLQRELIIFRLLLLLLLLLFNDDVMMVVVVVVIDVVMLLLQLLLPLQLLMDVRCAL